MPQQQKTYEVGKTYTLNVSELKPNPQQVRQHFDEDKLNALAESIEKDGLLQNISFTQYSDELIIVAGERRFQAVKKLGHANIEGKYVEGDLFQLALVENILREDLTAIEYSECLKQLKEKQDVTLERLGAIIGKKKSTVSEILKLNELPQTMRDEARNCSELTRQDLLKITKIKDSKRKEAAFAKLLAMSAEEKNTKEKNTSDVQHQKRNSKVQAKIKNIYALKEKFDKIWEQELKDITKEEAQDLCSALQILIENIKNLEKKYSEEFK